MLSIFRFSGLVGYLLASAVLTSGVHAAQPSVPYVPTPQEVVERMLEMAKVGPRDYVIDLGSGDGRIVVTAAKKFGARGFGVDLNPVRIKEARENAAKAGVSDRVSFQERNLFDTDLSDATVITMYLLPRVNLDLRPKLLALRAGTRIVSHDFDMADWKPDQAADMEVKAKYGDTPGTSAVYFWVVPARVAGIWRWQQNVGGKPVAYELTMDQNFQMISGTVRTGERSYQLQDASLRGDQISLVFTADVNGSALKHELSGRVTGDAIVGTAIFSGNRARGESEWNAIPSVETGRSADARPVAAAGR